MWNEYEEQKIKALQMKISHNMIANQKSIAISECLDLKLQVYEAVKSRDKEKVFQLIMEELNFKPEVLNEDDFRTLKKEYVLFVVALSERLVQDRLLELETSFSLLKIGIQLIEAAQSDIEVIHVVIAGVFEYMKYIEERICKSNHNLIILVKDYIQNNLTSKINIGVMAQEIGTNSSYLSRLFHQKEGITIQQYICNQRIKQAEKLLCFSNYSNEEISRFLCFSSQSHFGKILKESTGMTPNQYRLKCKMS
jgi:AraC-like DNA-binding protein